MRNSRRAAKPPRTAQNLLYIGPILASLRKHDSRCCVLRFRVALCLKVVATDSYLTITAERILSRYPESLRMKATKIKVLVYDMECFYLFLSVVRPSGGDVHGNQIVESTMQSAHIPIPSQPACRDIGYDSRELRTTLGSSRLFLVFLCIDCRNNMYSVVNAT